MTATTTAAVKGGAVGAFVLLFLLGAGPARAQPGNGWWKPVSVQQARGPSAQDAAAQGARRGPPGRAGPRGRRRGLHVPKGHLPPPGRCRLWYPGQPPGQQPPPLSCEEAYAQRRGPAVVIHGSGAAPPRWRRRPADDLVFRRSPPREKHGGFSVEIIVDILGRWGFEQLSAQQRQGGKSGRLTGRWVQAGRSGGHVLQIRAGGRPFAELADRDGDGRVERLLVRERRGKSSTDRDHQ